MTDELWTPEAKARYHAEMQRLRAVGGSGVSDHADTIRRARESAEWWIDNEGDNGTISGRSMNMARDFIAALDALLAELEISNRLNREHVEQANALLAERQQAQEERDELRAALNLSEESCRAGWSGRQQAIDALRDIARVSSEPPSHSAAIRQLSGAHNIARAALVKLGEKP